LSIGEPTPALRDRVKSSQDSTFAPPPRKEGIFKGTAIQMRITSRAGVLVILIAVLGTKFSWADKIKTDFDKSASFSGFKTYAFKPGLLMLAEGKERVDDQMISAMRRELNAKGLTEVKENPSLFVTYFGTLGAVSSSGNLYAPGQQARYDWGIPQGWSGVTSDTVLTGSLLIEVVNASSRLLLWRARIEGAVKNLNKPEKQGPRINEFVQKAFKDFPPKEK
jgi:hypothetical protein